MLQMFSKMLSGQDVISNAAKAGDGRVFIDLKQKVISGISKDDKMTGIVKLSNAQVSEIQSKLNLFTLSPTLCGKCKLDNGLNFVYCTDKQVYDTEFKLVYMQPVA